MGKEYFFLSEAIERGHSREKLIGLGKRGVLPFYVYFHGGVPGKAEPWEGTKEPRWTGTMLPGPYQIDIPGFCFVLSGKPIDCLRLPWKLEPPEKAVLFGFGECVFKLETPTIFSESDLVIMAADLENLGRASSDQATALAESTSDEIIWTWPEMELFSKKSRKTIENHASWLKISFLERPPKRGNKPEKGLRESDLRRIINNR